ncbi:MAG: hypothetical protein J3R72DRAFT_198344 [Linnemannia gamsii]|nr:MAG: hypothetical protein J3R72DRAFT_198344 [Linnemannia gamsii]
MDEQVYSSLSLLDYSVILQDWSAPDKKTASKRHADASTDGTNKRSCVTQACDHCRQRRVKCDLTKPRCSQCERVNNDCTFLIQPKKRGPAARTIKKETTREQGRLTLETPSHHEDSSHSQVTWTQQQLPPSQVPSPRSQSPPGLPVPYPQPVTYHQPVPYHQPMPAQQIQQQIHQTQQDKHHQPLQLQQLHQQQQLLQGQQHNQLLQQQQQEQHFQHQHQLQQQLHSQHQGQSQQHPQEQVYHIQQQHQLHHAQEQQHLRQQQQLQQHGALVHAGHSTGHVDVELSNMFSDYIQSPIASPSMSALASPNNPTPSSFGIVSSGTSGPTAIPPSAVLTPGASATSAHDAHLSLYPIPHHPNYSSVSSFSISPSLIAGPSPISLSSSLTTPTTAVPSTSPFSKEVTDHLVGLFFEYSFQDLHFLDPVAFLRGYANGSANPTLLNAICMVAARFSTHPAVLKNPPRMSGEPYAERIRAQIGMLIMDNSIDNVHTLALLSFYEYISGNSLTGYRFEGFAGRMAQELITRNKLEVRRSFPSEEARLTYEVNVRTFSYLLLSDCVSAAISGLPPSLGNTWRNLAIPSDDIEWWAMKGQAGHATMQLDEFSESVLARIRRPRHIRGYGSYEHICSIFQIMPLISKFTNSGAEKGELSQLSGPVNTSLFSSPERRSQYIQLGQQLEQWRDQLPEDYDPWRTRITISRVDANSIGMSTYYFVLQILLHRPILIRATTLVQANQETIHNHNIELELQNDGGQGRGTGGATDTDYHGEDDEYESDMDDFTDQEEEEEEENEAVDDDRALLRTALETCSLAASEIVGIIEHYSHDWIKYRGNIMSYQVFIASTVLIMILFSSKNPAELARAKQQLETCFHFLEVVTPYWALGGDQLQFLKSLLSGDLSGIMGGGASPATAASGQTTPSTTTPATSDESSSVSTSVHPTGVTASSGSYAKEGSPAIMGEVDRLMASKGPDGASGTSSAFLTTDSGMNTVWLDAESLGAVEEATVLSLNKMSMLHTSDKPRMNKRPTP